ncbi:hypothetical protein ACWEFJ_19855 [Actinosynnema sp. NPDC004786]
MNSKSTPPAPDIRYEAASHEALVDLAKANLDTVKANRIVSNWADIGKTLGELAEAFSGIVRRSTEQWTGEAGEKARAALLKVGRFCDMASSQFTRTSETISAQTEIAGEAALRMPPVVKPTPEEVYYSMVGTGDVISIVAAPRFYAAQYAKSLEAKAQAVDVLYARDNALHSAALGMPQLDEPPKVTREQDVVTGDSQPSSVSTRSVDSNVRIGNVGGTGTATAATTQVPGPTVVGGSDGTTRASWTAPSTTPPPLTPPSPGYHQPPVTPPGLPPAMMPPGRRPATGPVVPPRGVTPPGGGSPVGGGRGGRPGVPGGFPAAGGGGAGAPGGPGVPGGAQRAGGFGPAGSGAFGSSGGQGRVAPGMAPVGAAAPAGTAGAEDQEHQTKYLIPTDEYFDDTRMVAPETIGE